MRSVIFDFNGTLFRDSDKHMAAWHVFADRYGKHVSEQELVKFFLGRANAFILRRMFGEGIDDGEIARMALGKEGIYRDDGSFPGKPHPDCFLRAAEMLHAVPEECVVFEDSYSGVKAAGAARVGKIALIAEKAPEWYEKNARSVACITKDFTGMIRIWKESLSV